MYEVSVTILLCDSCGYLIKFEQYLEWGTRWECVWCRTEQNAPGFKPGALVVFSGPYA